MDLETKLIIILGMVLGLAAIMVITVISYNQRPKWLKVYDHIRNIMWQHLMDDDLDYPELGIIIDDLEYEFKLTEAQSKLCIDNWRKREWFEQQDFLKEDETSV